MDSIATLEIVFAMEEEFGLEVEDDELQAGLFDSVKALSKYVESKLPAHRAISP
ncbi:MAG: acyl carrier protein [Gemmatimonadaceae bacterium]|nr:acyl carrier protein [Gemmatimonadaceae bacterium]